MLHRGVPGPQGGPIERMDSDVLEPIAAVRSAEGWVLLELDGRIMSTSEGQFVHEALRLATLFFSWAVTGRRRSLASLGRV